MTRIGYEYFGSQINGNYVQWPGTNWCPADYDPRFRPWYAAAAAGPKDVVIVIDDSGSMNDVRVELARQAARTVLDTLTAVDYVSIVGFGSTAFKYSTSLKQATDANLQAMKLWIDNSIYASSGSTNFRDAFSAAFSIFDSSSQGSNCNRVILFLSDGVPTTWTDSDEIEVQRRSKSDGNDLATHIFTYALGDDADTDILKRISCKNNGVMQQVSDPYELPHAMASYYAFLSPFMAPCQTRWIEYTDLISNERLYGACKAMHRPREGSTLSSCEGGLDSLVDNEDGEVASLLGVTCLDLNLLVDLNIMKNRSDWASFESRIQLDQRRCPSRSLSYAQYESLRARVAQYAMCSPPKIAPRLIPLFIVVPVGLIFCVVGGYFKIQLKKRKQKNANSGTEMPKNQFSVQSPYQGQVLAGSPVLGHAVNPSHPSGAPTIPAHVVSL